MELFRILKSRLTMKFQRVLFWDRINGIAVCEYKDCYGDVYIAQSIFGMRIKR